MMRRCEFLMHAAAGGAAVVVARKLGAQQDTTRPTTLSQEPASSNTSNLFDMRRSGFNILGYLVPFVALGAGAVALTVVLRRMVRSHTRADVALPPDPVPATDAELARLQAAIRKDD